ncbi:hypothetical protein BGW80DRAFT_1460533 [Lactifluus volemus]|nr:hypothetical protein BGW80DRAFT_1460533 [Lactifluus volemus]
MPRTAADKVTKPRIPDINWSANKSSLIWALLVEIEKDENYRVLYGKKDVTENTCGETKVAVYNRIAETILLDMYSLYPTTVRDRIKGKLEGLTNCYKKHAKRLHQTGEGVDNNNGSQGSEETLSFYIMGDGPCVKTPPHAVNIWKQIEQEFPFFPTLHRIFASRPNVTPIVVTTALGPQGQKTVWYQPPDDNSNIDPELLKESVPPAAGHLMPQRECSFGNYASGFVNTDPPSPEPASQAVNIKKSATPGPQRGPKPSMVSRDAMENARKAVAKLPQKRSIADTLMEIQRENLAAQRSQNRRRINLELRKQITDELKIGLWTREQAQEKISALENDDSPHSAKRQRRAVREPSPDWDEITSSSDDF